MFVGEVARPRGTADALRFMLLQRRMGFAQIYSMNSAPKNVLHAVECSNS